VAQKFKSLWGSLPLFRYAAAVFLTGVLLVVL